jgi:hypothetical protein
MARIDGKARAPVDPELERISAEQREFQANNRPLQEGMSAARKAALENERRILDGTISDVRRKTADKDVSQPKRDNYDRAYNVMETAAQRWADSTGESVTIPVRDVPAPFPAELHAWVRSVAEVLAKHKIEIPQLPTPQTTRVIRPRSGAELTAAGRYHEHGARPTGIAPNRSDGQPNEVWLNLQGVAE